MQATRGTISLSVAATTAPMRQHEKGQFCPFSHVHCNFLLQQVQLMAAEHIPKPSLPKYIDMQLEQTLKPHPIWVQKSGQKLG